MRRILLLFAISTILLGGCQKKDLILPENTPIFSVSFELENGKSVFWEAGIDGFEITMDQLDEEFYKVFRSSMNNTISTSSNQFSIDLILQSDKSPENLIPISLDFFKLMPQTLKNNLSINTQSELLVSNTIQLNNETPHTGIQNLEFLQHTADTLRFNFLMGDFGHVRANQILHPSLSASYGIEINISHEIDRNDIEIRCQNGCSVLWDDGYRGHTREIAHFQNQSVRVSSPEWGHASIDFLLLPVSASTETKLKLQNNRTNINPLHFVDILFVDEDGTRFRSRNATQSQISFFNLENSAPYLEKYDGLLVHTFEGRFDAMLASTSGEQIRLKNGAFKMAFPIKE